MHNVKQSILSSLCLQFMHHKPNYINIFVETQIFLVEEVGKQLKIFLKNIYMQDTITVWKHKI